MTTWRQQLRAKHHDRMRRYVKVAALLPTDWETFDFHDPVASAELEMVLAELHVIQSAMDEVVREAQCLH